jgi:signal transduction histidine kinase
MSLPRNRRHADLGDSRRRIAEAGDLGRARIERDLHDGAQQRLVALRIRLGMAEDLLATDPRSRRSRGPPTRVRGGSGARRAALPRAWRLPMVAERQGLPDALRSMAIQTPLPVHVVTVGVTRHPIEIESAVYFACVEAVQNALKHARSAMGVWITLKQTRTRLRFEVRDDGAGFQAETVNGRGLRTIHDRIEAVGGHVKIEALPERGTHVRGSVPLRGNRPGVARDFGASRGKPDLKGVVFAGRSRESKLLPPLFGALFTVRSRRALLLLWPSREAFARHEPARCGVTRDRAAADFHQTQNRR